MSTVATQFKESSQLLLHIIPYVIQLRQFRQLCEAVSGESDGLNLWIRPLKVVSSEN
jgi:hypothetical protein